VQFGATAKLRGNWSSDQPQIISGDEDADSVLENSVLGLVKIVGFGDKMFQRAVEVVHE